MVNAGAMRLTNLLRAYASAAERGIPKDCLPLELQFWVDKREAARLAGDKKAQRHADDSVKEYEQFILLAEQGKAGSNTPPPR